jgi:hypothetical protein
MSKLNNPSYFDLKGLKIAHININRISNKIPDLILCINKFHFDFLFVSETWLTDEISHFFLSINGYKILNINRQYSCGGGLLCYVLDKHDVSIHSAIAIQSIEYLNLLLKFPNNSNPMLFSCIYRKPSSDDSFFINFSSMIESLISYKYIFIIGDFNICALKKKYPYKKLKQLIQQFCLTQLITTPTHNKSCIDHIYTNISLQSSIHQFGTIDIDFSDHKIIYFSIKKTTQMIKPQQSNEYHYNKYNFDQLPQFASTLENNLLLLDLNTSDPDCKLNSFLKIFSSSSTIVNTKVPITKKMKKKVEWINAEYSQLARKRTKYFKVFQKDNDMNAYICFKYYRNRANNLAKRLKAKIVLKMLTVSSPKIFWSNLKNILPNKFNNKSSINLSNLPSCHTFCDYFSNVAVNILSQENLPPFQFSKIENESDYFKFVSPKFSFSLTEPSSLIFYINKIPSTLHHDNLGISSFLLKYSRFIIAPYISNIFNSYIELGRFPASFKIAKVTPILKSGDPTNPSNYRPISVLPSLSKIFEYILDDQINEFINKNSILNDYQFGFRKYHSTMHAITYFIDKILQFLNDSSNVITMFLDVKKAFDLLSHKMLL